MPLGVGTVTHAHQREVDNLTRSAEGEFIARGTSCFGRAVAWLKAKLNIGDSREDNQRTMLTFRERIKERLGNRIADMATESLHGDYDAGVPLTSRTIRTVMSAVQGSLDRTHSQNVNMSLMMSIEGNAYARAGGFGFGRMLQSALLEHGIPAFEPDGLHVRRDLDTSGLAKRIKQDIIDEGRDGLQLVSHERAKEITRARVNEFVQSKLQVLGKLDQVTRDEDAKELLAKFAIRADVGFPYYDEPEYLKAVLSLGLEAGEAMLAALEKPDLDPRDMVEAVHSFYALSQARIAAIDTAYQKVLNQLETASPAEVETLKASPAYKLGRAVGVANTQLALDGLHVALLRSNLSTEQVDKIYCLLLWDGPRLSEAYQAVGSTWDEPLALDQEVLSDLKHARDAALSSARDNPDEALQRAVRDEEQAFQLQQKQLHMDVRITGEAKQAHSFLRSMVGMFGMESHARHGMDLDSAGIDDRFVAQENELAKGLSDDERQEYVREYGLNYLAATSDTSALISELPKSPEDVAPLAERINIRLRQLREYPAPRGTDEVSVAFKKDLEIQERLLRIKLEYLTAYDNNVVNNAAMIEFLEAGLADLDEIPREPGEMTHQRRTELLTLRANLQSELFTRRDPQFQMLLKQDAPPVANDLSSQELIFARREDARSTAERLKQSFKQPIPAEERTELMKSFDAIQRKTEELQSLISENEFAKDDATIKINRLRRARSQTLVGLTGGGEALEIRHKAVRNWQKADSMVNDMVKNGKPLTFQSILEINRILSDGLPAKWGRPGELRERTVESGFQYPFPEHVEGLMRDFTEWYQKNAATMNPIELAAAAYQKLASLHPFSDANGRTSRLIVDYILQSHGLPPACFGLPEKVQDLTPAQAFKTVATAVSRSHEIMSEKLGDYGDHVE